MDYNATVNLPKTAFPMRAGLPAREPGMLKSWYDMDLYHETLRRNEGKPLFILHDGPPFSNGNLHMGHALPAANQTDTMLKVMPSSARKPTAARSQKMGSMDIEHPSFFVYYITKTWK